MAASLHASLPAHGLLHTPKLQSGVSVGQSLLPLHVMVCAGPASPVSMRPMVLPIGQAAKVNETMAAADASVRCARLRMRISPENKRKTGGF